jgi:hypothetical protein
MKKMSVLWSLLVTLTTVFSQHDHNSTSVLTTGAHAPQNNFNTADDPNFHGMLLLGKDVFYASHWPMFMVKGPHKYQGIFKVKLDAASAKLFQADQAAHPEYTTYSIAPLEAFILPEMVEKTRFFKAALYRGHFERGGERIAKSIDITIEKVIIFKKFEKTVTRDNKSKYIVFGSGKERFIAHLIWLE